MKTLILYCTLAFIASSTFAKGGYMRVYEINMPITHLQPDSVKMIIDGTRAYYQKTVKVDSNITEGLIYIRAMQFMASKNIQQNYGYEEEGKLIFTTIQDLNINPVYAGDDNEILEPYTAQFAITLDLKNGRYRYTIHNILFFIPVENGNKRETLYDIYQKAVNSGSRRQEKNAKNLIASFERYITTLTAELYDDIEQKLLMHNSKF